MLDNVLDFIRATEEAAIAASKWVGTGEKVKADEAATEAMIRRFGKIDFAGRVAIGEGKKDKSAGLFFGDRVGKLKGKVSANEELELAVDPIDGTRPTVTSGPEALSVVALAEPGSLLSTDVYYMNKLAYGPEIKNKVVLKLTDPIEHTIRLISAATGKDFSKIMVCLLDRPRHESIVKELRKLGVRIKLIQDCDISGAIATCLPESGIDLLCGVGGAPEGVITACAMKCLQGGFQAQLADKEGKVQDLKVYGIDEIVSGHCVFAATGITNGSLLRGVRYTSLGPVTNSVIMRSKSGTVRWVTAHHGN